MTKRVDKSTNFEFLRPVSTRMWQLGLAAERTFAYDPAAAIVNMRKLIEAIVKQAVAHQGLYVGPEDKLASLIQTLGRQRVIDRRLQDALHWLRKLGNDAAHFTDGGPTVGHHEAIQSMRMGRELGWWYVKTFEPIHARRLKKGSFVTPADPTEALRKAQDEVTRLKAEQAESQEGSGGADAKTAAALAQELAAAERCEKEEAQAAKARMEEERDAALELAAEVEAHAQAALKAEVEAQVADIEAALAEAEKAADEATELALAAEEQSAEKEAALKAQADAICALKAELEAARAAQKDHAERQTEMSADEREALEQQAFERALATLKNKAVATQLKDIERQRAESLKVWHAAQLSEADARQFIDQQLRDAGWEADSLKMTHARGVRPAKGQNMAIAEWPTASGPADYVLFIGLMPVAIVEAKKPGESLESALGQAERYSVDYVVKSGERMPGPALTWTAGFKGWPAENTGSDDGGANDDVDRDSTFFRIPFIYASNSQALHRQFLTSTGVWHRDVRKPTNISKALRGFATPGELENLLDRDLDAAQRALGGLNVDKLQLGLRHYQQAAIHAVEAAIGSGQQHILLSMATGTGKTRTTLGLLYRLVQTGRFRRALFLVDRSALGKQALDDFLTKKIDQNQSFADIFDIKGLDDKDPDPETRVHIATVQSMVRRCLDLGLDEPPIPHGRYDLIVVDESHRGYNLDRDMEEGAGLVFDQESYVSRYRQVLDYFDAVKIGLTATPAAHTTAIFGMPVFEYSYEQAVLDGFLVDHEPPFRIETQLSQDGIHFDKGDKVWVKRPEGVQLSLLPDELNFDVSDFNRKVVADAFTEVVCDTLTKHIDPTGDEKTLVFCVTDAHADKVVAQLRQSFAAEYEDFQHGAVWKITGQTKGYKGSKGAAGALAYFKNESMPSVAVTVDLLTTGIDVPAITNLVFLRRVKSRILYEQMLGRATRLCPDIKKSHFKIFDAVGLYDALEPVTAMKPQVRQSNVSIGTLLKALQNPMAHVPLEIGKGLLALATAKEDAAKADAEDADAEEGQLGLRVTTGAAGDESQTDHGDGTGTFAEVLEAIPPHQLVAGNTLAEGLKNQVVMKLRRQDARAERYTHKKNVLPPGYFDAEAALVTLTGHKAKGLADHLSSITAEEVRRMLDKDPSIAGAIETYMGCLRGLHTAHVIYGGNDELVSVTQTYGDGNQRPGDYLAEFRQFVRDNENTIAALRVVMTKPRDLSRQDLKTLKATLQSHGYTKTRLAAAYKAETNQEIAASIIGWVRQQALGTPALSYEERLLRAQKKALSLHQWSKSQQKWLERIFKQMKEEVIVNRESMGHGIFAQKGGAKGVDKQLDGRLDDVLDAIADGMWGDVG